MSEKKHTPGPWASGKLNQGYRAGTIPVVTSDYLKSNLSSRTGRIIADVYGSIGEQEANARLIAAAPELLEGAKVAWVYVSDILDCGMSNSIEVKELEKMLRDAIWKATKGEDTP
jgi:hypothetical protein